MPGVAEKGTGPRRTEEPDERDIIKREEEGRIPLVRMVLKEKI